MAGGTGSDTRYGGEDVENGGDGDVDGSGDGYVENQDHDDWAAWVNGGGNDFTKDSDLQANFKDFKR